MIILDASACIDYLDGNENLKDILKENEDIWHVTTITVYEMKIGFERTRRKISEERYPKKDIRRKISEERYKSLYRDGKELIREMEIFPLVP